ncbi:MAG: urease accessory protein UreE [Cyanobium sp.]
MSEPLLLCHRLGPAAADGPPPPLVLSLSAADRQRLRGHGRSRCGRDLLLQLPRGEALEPGERLADGAGVARVRVEAAPEPLLRVRCDDPLLLLRAAYHLGNRHVALELAEGELRLLHDPVLAELLRGLGVAVEAITAPFLPERGAYGSAGGHNHSHAHTHGPDVQSHGDRGHPRGDVPSPGMAQASVGQN